MRFSRVSRSELERRWALVRGLLEERGLDALVTLCSDDDMGGYVRWLTDGAVLPYRRGIIFDRTEPMAVVEHGGLSQYRQTGGQDPNYPGINEIFGTAEFPAVDYSLHYEAEIMVREIRRRGYRRLALVGAGNMPHRFVSHFLENLAGTVEIVDLTEQIDGFMVVKSPEEIELIRKAAALQDRIIEVVLENARPGMRDADVTALARAEAQRHGAEGGIILAGSGPQGTFAAFRPISLQNRVIENGDYLSLLVENSAPGGYFTEVARTIVFGKAGAQLSDAVATATEMQQSVKKLFVPGTSCAEIFERHNTDRGRYGLPPEDRIFAHGQGYNLVERPLIRHDEPMTVKEGMNFAIHPTVADGRTVFAIMCDNYVVQADGLSECLHRTPQQIFEI
ncbi:M24 family metallopeptidase [Rhizobium rhizogenes]|uniref:M24 family metallopeptidase n=1 Tax=Rhizobium rhizogenes TaxID=359 RepID=UPI001574CBE6|nr:M24 family metallopeptidase [Rhizobium rhizogenes]NTI78471.1 M24 family metallopeptidase [Rhizobium rhizogenes]